MTNISEYIDRPTIHEFVTVLHDRAASALNGARGVLHLCTHAPDDHGMATQAFNIGDISGMVEAAVLGAESGRNIYVEGRVTRPGLPKERGRACATVGVFAFVIDHDADKNRAGCVNGDASAVVETSPGNCHEWLFLKCALSADAAKPIGDIIRKGCGADACSGVITGLYRCAGTPNFPCEKKRLRGRTIGPTKLISITDKLWAPDEIEAAFSTDKAQATRTQPSEKAADSLKTNGLSPNTLRLAAAVKRKLARKVTPETDRSSTFQSAVHAAVLAGITADQFEELARQYPDGCASKYLENGDRLKQEIARSYTKTEQPAEPIAAPQPPVPRYPKCTLAEAHDVFQRWLGEDYDIAVLDAVLAVAAAEKLPGDPAWLLVISGPGNAKTETVQATSGLGAHVVSTISSEGALLSASGKGQRDKNATGGLLRQIGEHGVLCVKDVTSILSMHREARSTVLAALREIHDGHWVRNVGIDGGKKLEWRGRITVIGACSTAWDQAHAVITMMGDRFPLIRSDSHKNRIKAGLRAMRNTGLEPQMRQELAAAVAGVVSHIDISTVYQLRAVDEDRIAKAADIVTLARTGVEIDYRGDVIDAHQPEMPTRFAKQLTQIMRGAIAIGMRRVEALKLVIRCARDSMPPLRLAVLRDVAANPDAPIIEVRRRLQKPRATVDRALQALHTLGLLTCREEEEERGEKQIYHRHYTLARDVRLNVLKDPIDKPESPA
jgi:hypothetical protein